MIINGDISFNDVKSIVVDGEKIEIDDSIYNNIDNSFNFLESFRKNKIIYGITTGFGPMAQYRVNDEYLYQLQYNIIRSHSTGAGDKLPDIYVRAAMLSRLNAFLRGYSGVHRELIDLMVNFLNLEIYPVIPAHGGVGASGDLVQMAHLALALIGEGKVSHKGDIRDATEVLNVYNLKPLTMHIREGLALANGTSMMTGIGLVNLYYSKKLLKWSILSSLMMNEITGSYDDFASERLNGAKPHNGQQYIAQELRRLITSSKRLKKRESELYSGENHSPVFDEKVQSFYSIRCIPQILGPISDEIDNAEKVLINELNSANDNP
ncbi:MAG: aromatic amino acid lyase, partial [Bacteroidales bacterium]|nr:aromatic amino acid lyase [Bacteroidales bacterium]